MNTDKNFDRPVYLVVPDQPEFDMAFPDCYTAAQVFRDSGIAKVFPAAIHHWATLGKPTSFLIPMRAFMTFEPYNWKVFFYRHKHGVTP